MTMEVRMCATKVAPPNTSEKMWRGKITFRRPRRAVPQDAERGGGTSL